jgi:uncharacterized protein
VTRTDAAPSFLTARWIQLAMVNYEVDPGLLQRLVPNGTALDFWSGRCFVSVVGFRFVDTRVLGLSIPFHRNFDEVNLRFYVKRLAGGEVRRGVVFVKEIVPRRAIAWLANTLYNEKYIALAMAHDDATATPRRSLTYKWRYNGAWCRLGVTLDGGPYLPGEESEEAFITEHYWGYVVQRDGSTREYQVEHPRWRVWKGTSPEFVCDVSALYGQGFASPMSRAPSSCFVADGSAIVVRRPRPVPA